MHYNEPHIINLDAFDSLPNDFYTNQKWKQTFFHKLSCQSLREYYGEIYILEIKSNLVNDIMEGFLYILQRMCYETENWNKKKVWTLTSKQFINFIISEGYVNNLLGERIEPILFYRTYKNLINGISKQDGFCYEINSKTINPSIDKSLINEIEIKSIYQFSNDLNAQQYLIETHDKFFYFDWRTSV